MDNVIFKNKNFKLIKTSGTTYKILDKKNELVLALEGDYTKEELEFAFNNCTEHCIFL